MQYGKWMLTSIIDSEKGAHEFIKIDPAPELFKGTEVELFEFIKEHITKHGVPPARETVAFNLPEISLPTEVPEPATYYHELMRKRHDHMALKTTMIECAKLLNADSPKEAKEEVFSTLIELRRVDYRNRVIDYAQEGHDIIQAHLIAAKKGLTMGVPFGWPSVDDESLGAQPGDFISFIGRPGIGKTYMLLYLMLHAWSRGHIPMFVSMEMNPQLITQRLAAMDTHTSATQIKTGGISGGKEESMKATLLENKNKLPAWILDGGMSSRVDDLIMHTIEKKPDIVYVDGAYLLKSAVTVGRASRWERISDNAEMIKREICEGLKVPAVCSYQFNRDSMKKKKQEEIGLEHIAGADVIGQISSLVFGMFEEESVETLDRRQINILKGRYGETGEFKVRWVFDKPTFMDFTEIEEETLEDLGSL